MRRPRADGETRSVSAAGLERPVATLSRQLYADEQPRARSPQRDRAGRFGIFHTAAFHTATALLDIERGPWAAPDMSPCFPIHPKTITVVATFPRTPPMTSHATRHTSAHELDNRCSKAHTDVPVCPGSQHEHGGPAADVPGEPEVKDATRARLAWSCGLAVFRGLVWPRQVVNGQQWWGSARHLWRAMCRALCTGLFKSGSEAQRWRQTWSCHYAIDVKPGDRSPRG